jgi:hypothetical protein
MIILCIIYGFIFLIYFLKANDNNIFIQFFKALFWPLVLIYKLVKLIVVLIAI